MILLVAMCLSALNASQTLAQTETEIVRDQIAPALGVPPEDVEVALWDGTRVDLITGTHVVEVDWAEKWAEGIGQALYYSVACQCDKGPELMLLLTPGVDESRHIYRAQAAAARAGVKVTQWIVQEGPPTPPPDPEPPAAGAPVIDVAYSVAYSATRPRTDKFWVWFTDPDTAEDENGEQTWNTFSGTVSGVYTNQAYTHNLNEGQLPVAPGVWFCVVEDYQGNRSAEVAFELLADGTLQIPGSSPPDPTPDPVPGITKVRLEWVAPAENADGSALDDLAGFRVYRGQASGIYDHDETVGPATITLDQDLEPGTYYFCVEAFDFFGNRSPCSEEINHVVIQ